MGMKICHFREHGYTRLGILIEDEEIIDVQKVWSKFYQKEGYYSYHQRSQVNAPSSLSDVLKIYQENSIDFFKETQEKFKLIFDQGDIDYTPLINTSLLKPLDQINCYRDFYIHEKHVKKGFEKRNEPVPAPWYEMPVYYKGATSGFIGPKQNIPWPSYTDKLDYELELGAVIMRDGFNIKEEKALNHVFGYTVFNDISARDIQKKEMAVRLGPSKGKDFCSVIGPVIVTADEFNGAEPNLKMKAYINDELWSEGMSGDGQFTWAQMIAHASHDEWLITTDFLGSGTVGTGCGLELDKWIKPDDIIRLEIEKIGTLENTVGHKRI